MKLLKVIGDRIAVQPLANPKSGNLLLTDSHIESRNLGLVVLKSETLDSSIKEGDKVLYSKAVSDSLLHEGTEIQLVNINSIFAIVE